MRVVTVRTPEGQGARIAEMALAMGLREAAVHQVAVHRNGGARHVEDVVELEAAAPRARAFVDELTAAPFFDPARYSCAIREARAVVGREGPGEETDPVPIPAAEIYEELWKFSHVTWSFVGRILMASILVAYGMIEHHLPVLLAGLLFLPYHHALLGAGFALATRETRLLRHAALAFVVSTLLVVAASAFVAWLTEPPLAFQELGSPLTGFLFAVVIGAAAALASADDAGRRELIGLAATAHITVLPAWFGVSLVFGFADRHRATMHVLQFVIAIVTFVVTTGVTYALLRTRGAGLRRFARLSARPGAPAPAHP